MARGFESKSVEAQQEEAARQRSRVERHVTTEERAVEDRRRALLLSRSRVQADLGRATVPTHRRMLQQAIDALDAQLRELSGS